MKVYTDEQLSRILSCSAEGKLGEPYNGSMNRESRMVCIEQAAHATYGSNYLTDSRIVDSRAALWDDIGYLYNDPRPTAVLRWLEKKQLA